MAVRPMETRDAAGHRMTRNENRTVAPASSAALKHGPGADDHEQMFRKAMQLYEKGRVHDAEQLYQAILDADPSHFGSLHFLGLIRAQNGRFDDAIKLLRKAIEQNPSSADAHVNIAVVYEMIDRSEEAISHCDKALAAKPDCAEAHFTAGNALKALARPEDAVARYKQAIAIDPKYVE